MKNRLWHPSTTSAVRPQSVQPASKNGFTKAAARAMAMHKQGDSHANFKCPSCKVFFVLEYGVFGTTRHFEQPVYYCRDCSKKPTFTRA
jgi:hypothetical protein